MDKNTIGVGVMIMITVGILVALSFWGLIGDNVGEMTNTFYVVNQTVTMPASGSTLELYGSNIVGNAIITNTSGGEVVPTSNYSIAQGLGADGYIATILTASDGNYETESVNVTYTYQPDGYVTSSGGRAMVDLIAIFLAIAVIALTLYPVAKSKGWLDFR